MLQVLRRLSTDGSRCEDADKAGKRKQDRNVAILTTLSPACGNAARRSADGHVARPHKFFSARIWRKAEAGSWFLRGFD